MKNWEYNEFKHCGVDYSQTEQAEKYDNRHNQFRDFEKEFIGMIDFLSLKNTETLTMIDLGCGTGTASIYAAKKFKKVYGVDISDEMIHQAKAKAENEKLHNIEFIKSGFLSYRHHGEPADLLITKVAFHHLPDFWKQAALLNMNRMLKKGGILYIFDVVYHFNPEEYEDRIDEWIDGLEIKAGKEFRGEIETHIRDEFSTFHWILEGMIERAGFRVERSRTSDGFMTEYFCVKD